MVTFLIAIVLLVLGYLVYSKIIERVLVVDPKRATPAVAHPDGVDYVPMKPWRIYLIQFLNIAGVGPICGAIMGAQFGSASFLWIVFGSIFAGAVHDFIAGFISIRRNRAAQLEIVKQMSRQKSRSSAGLDHVTEHALFTWMITHLSRD